MKIEVFKGHDNPYSKKIADALKQWNLEQRNSANHEHISVIAKDGEVFLGDANIQFKWDWCFIDDLIVLKPHKGNGLD